MDFDSFSMTNIEDMEYNSTSSIGCWYEVDDCGSDNDDCGYVDCTTNIPLSDGSDCMIRIDFGDDDE